MDKIVFLIQKKPINNNQRSLDLALHHLKNNEELKFNRWIIENGNAKRIARTSYQRIVLAGLKNINAAISRYFPTLTAFEIIQSPWRSDKFHHSIKRNDKVKIEEDGRYFYIEVAIQDDDSTR